MSWGPNSIILTIAIGNGLVLAGLLWRAGWSRAFLRPLGALVALIAIRLMPYAIGFAGAYDHHPWLTFAPFDFSLAFGPLVWMYVSRISTGQWPRRWRWHFAPVLLQAVYQLVAFSLPLDAKWEWYTTTHNHIVEPLGLALVIASLTAYVFAGWRQFTTWQRWMDDQLSNREAYRLGVVRVVLLGMAIITVCAALFALRSWLVAPTNFFDRFPLMLALAALAYVLGLAGWRQSAMDFPVMAGARTDPPALDTADVAARATGRPKQDYTALGQEWRARMLVERWYREPSLTLPDLANRLCVSPRTASRVLRDGLGLTFNAFVNRMRVEEVRERLADPTNTRELLPIALDAGFASKASFNRAFRDVTGTSPSTIRAMSAGERSAEV